MRGRFLAMAALAAITACGSAVSNQNGAAASINIEDLRGAATEAQERRFYEARQWQAAWSEQASAALIAALRDGARHGLDPGQWLASIEAAQGAAREVALTRAALAYAEALARGRTDPNRLFDPYSLSRPEFDAAAALNRVLGDGGDLATWFAALAPQDAEYRALSEAFLTARGQPPRQPVPGGADIRPGSADPRIAAITAALAADGYVAPPQGEQPQRYGPALVAAIRRLQEDYGLTPNGVITSDTLAALNEGPAGRARALAVNLERRRWLAREAPATRIDVNTASAELVYWDGGRAVDRRRVVVGQPGDETPQLGSPITRLVANPAWTVPRSIQEEEIAPRGAAYLARNNMEWRDGWIVQRSGPTNSLGLVKFDMQNDHAIYLHDTPATALFGQDDRHASHGCVRVQDASGFAALIADRQGIRDAWERARAGDEDASVPLERPIPVRLMYHSAFLDGGRVRYRLDAYGWDDVLARALGYPARAARPPRPHQRDSGP